MECIEDPTLPDSINGQRVLLASNLHNNEELLPHFILQLLQFIVSLPAGSSYVSIYESGSTDQTGFERLQPISAPDKSLLLA